MILESENVKIFIIIINVKIGRKMIESYYRHIWLHIIKIVILKITIITLTLILCRNKVFYKF